MDGRYIVKIRERRGFFFALYFWEGGVFKFNKRRGSTAPLTRLKNRTLVSSLYNYHAHLIYLLLSTNIQHKSSQIVVVTRMNFESMDTHI